MGQYMNKNICSNCNNSIENKKYLYKFVDNKNKSLYFCGKCIFYGINNNLFSGGRPPHPPDSVRLVQ